MYEYRCTKCNHVFEKIQKFSDPQISDCPKCGAPVEQVISAPAVQFKGAGWYVNDYAKKSGGKSGESKSGSSDVSSSSSESRSETKTETKTEAKSESKSESKSSDSSPKSDK